MFVQMLVLPCTLLEFNIPRPSEHSMRTVKASYILRMAALVLRVSTPSAVYTSCRQCRSPVVLGTHSTSPASSVSGTTAKRLHQGRWRGGRGPGVEWGLSEGRGRWVC